MERRGVAVHPRSPDAGATYGMPDALATYGLVMPGQDAWCDGDCYGLRVDADVRPGRALGRHARESTLPALATKDMPAACVATTLTIDPPACGATTLYTDVPAAGAYCRWVEEPTRRHVVTGAVAEYCPAQPVTREQTAVFLSVTFSLTLYGV